MTLQNQPTTYNSLQDVNFRFTLKRAPNVSFNVTKIALPGINLGEATQATPLRQVPRPGDHVEFNPLYMTFTVDENMSNYLEIWNWLIALGFPERNQQFAKLRQAGEMSGEGLVSDATLTILTNKKNPFADVEFHDMWPETLDDLNFNLQVSQVNNVEATVTFKYTHYKIHILRPFTSA